MNTPTTPPDPSSVRFPGPWHHFDVRANAIRMHAVEHQPDAPSDTRRPLVILLHGFGEIWWCWRHQMAALHDAGVRAVAVDLRGYGDTDKPPRGYDGWTISADADALVRALGHSRATFVGHGDGGLVCWAVATLHPRSVQSIAVLGAPHPRALKDALVHDRRQRRVTLAGFVENQIPRLAERRLTKNDGQFIEHTMTARAGADWQRTADFADAVARYRSAIQIPGVAYSSLEYRRWAFRSQFRPDGNAFLAQMNQQLQIPVAAIHGDDDPYLFKPVMHASGDYANDFALHNVSASGHYVHEERPDEVSAIVHDLAQR